MDNMIFTSEVCGVVLIAPFDKISRPPCSTIRFIVFLSLFFRCFSPFSFYHRTFSLTTLPVSHILRTVFSLMPPVRPIPWMLGWYGWASDFSDTSDSSRAPVHNEPASTKNSSRKHEKCVRLMLGLSVEAQCLLDSFPNETCTLSPLLQMPLYCPRSFSGTATYR